MKSMWPIRLYSVPTDPFVAQMSPTLKWEMAPTVVPRDIVPSSERNRDNYSTVERKGRHNISAEWRDQAG